MSRRQTVRLAARAKVNLSLQVLGRRPDGFHEIRTTMQTLEWFDELVMERAEKTRVAFDWGAGPPGPVPSAPDLVERAIGIINETLGGTQAADVRVVKNIPIGSGLGGGSADAGAAIVGMNALTGEVISDIQMMEIAAQVGSDVPFAISGGTAVAEGRGDVLKPLAHRPLWWVIGVPDFSLETAEVYARWDELRVERRLGGRGIWNKVLSTEEVVPPDVGDVEATATFLSNDLEIAAFDMMPALEDLKEKMRSAGGLGVVMSGSGPAIAGLCRDAAHAEQVASRAAEWFSTVKVAASAERGAEVLG